MSADAAAAGLVHVPLLNTWKVSDPALVLQILRHKAARVPDLSILVSHAETRHGLCLRSLKRAMAVLPVFLDGQAHADRRKSMALSLHEGLQRAQPHLSRAAAEIISAPLVPGADLVLQWVRPITRMLVQEITGMEIPASFFGRRLIEIFNCNQNIPGLKSLEAEFSAVFAELDKPGADPVVTDNRLIALVFGFDSLMSFLAENLVIALRRAHETDGALQLPEEPAGTGVPVTFRVAAAPFSVGNAEFSPGTRFMLEFGDFSKAGDASVRQGIFGAGAHACLGRMVSMAVWSAFRQHVNDAGIRARLRDCVTASSLFFRHYQSITVEISP